MSHMSINNIIFSKLNTYLIIFQLIFIIVSQCMLACISVTTITLIESFAVINESFSDSTTASSHLQALWKNNNDLFSFITYTPWVCMITSRRSPSEISSAFAARNALTWFWSFFNSNWKQPNSQYKYVWRILMM